MSEEKLARVAAARAELAAAESDLVEKHEFPKWVEPHASHIVGGVAALFKDSHLDRVSNKISVLVHSAEEEAAALAEMKSPEEPKAAETPAA